MQSEALARPPPQTDESVNKIRHHAALKASKSEQHLRSLRICLHETVTFPPRDVLSALSGYKQDHENYIQILH